MFRSLLIANRGEIACRVIRTARRMGVRTIAVHSEADRDALHVRLADEAHPIGPAPAAESYLRMGRILSVAKAAGAEALHPGYGFLSENGDFAGLCRDAGIAFVGPPAEAIRDMGLKDRAKAIMADAGVPVVPGYGGDNQKADFLKRKAYETGYPVLIKAVAGGGGKGMRVVARALDFDAALEGARREAQASFGNERVLIERYVGNPRHVEFQIFADTHGNVVHLWERDCSLQRRHQKVIEEAPAPGMTPALRAAMGEAACAAARAVGYQGAGTVEFIVEGGEGELKPDGFFFMEMNTRLQVEHPVTEAITGFDLVEWQLRVAAGQMLPLTQTSIDERIAARGGHAVEARVYAEDPAAGFLPSTGRIHAFEVPGADGTDDAVRVDSGVEAGSTITAHYDPMIAKVIAHERTRERALDRLDAALARTVIVGPRTNVAFLRRCLADETFRAGAFTTGLIDARSDTLVPRGVAGARERGAAAAAMVAAEQERNRRLALAAGGSGTSPWDELDAFQLGPPRREVVRMVHLDESVEVEGPFADGGLRTVVVGRDVFVLSDGQQFLFEPADPSVAADEAEEGSSSVRAPMTGRVIAVAVREGASVDKGAPLFVVEAMKMEHVVVAPRAGAVAEVLVAVGDQVSERTVGVTLRSDG